MGTGTSHNISGTGRGGGVELYTDTDTPELASQKKQKGNPKGECHHAICNKPHRDKDEAIHSPGRSVPNYKLLF